MTHDYDDIINLPHYTSLNHPGMTMNQRAAQFAPFAALTGHNAALRETARLTDCKIELSESEQRVLNERMNKIIDGIASKPFAGITHFVPDKRKSGGSYVITEGNLRKWDEYEQTLTFESGATVNLSNIIDIRIDECDGC